MDGDFFIGSALATNLTKLVLKYITMEPDVSKQNRICCSVMLTMSSIIHLGRSGFPAKPITNDDADRIFVCLKTLSERTSEVTEVFENLCRNALAKMLDAHNEEEQQAQKDKRVKIAKIQADDPISFAQLSNGKENLLGENLFETSLNQALAGTKRMYMMWFDWGFSNCIEYTATSITDTASPNSKLNKVTQLTGFSDPVYAEAYVHVNQYDIVLDVLIVNQTSKIVTKYKNRGLSEKIQTEEEEN